MIGKVVVTKKDDVFMKIQAEAFVLQEISDHFTFEVPNSRFNPKVKAGIWDGKIRLFNMWTGELYIGLMPRLYALCERNEYELVNHLDVTADDVSYDDFYSFVETLNVNIVFRGENVDARDYQLDAAHQAIVRGRTLLLSPTASGKSLIIYLIMRWHMAKGRKQLIIVPTTSLVEQMTADFADYGFDIKDIHKIYSGQEKVYDAKILISTWQSMYTMPAKFFHQFDVIYGDEAHLFKATSLKKIMESTIYTPYKIGTTGTLDGLQTNKLVLEGLFGTVMKVTTTKKLMDANQLAKLKITVIVIKYPDDVRKAFKDYDPNTKKTTKKKYRDEVDFLNAHEQRNRFIRNLALDQTSNTLLLFTYVEKHGKLLYDLISAGARKDRKVFFVHGKVDTDAREQIRAITEKETDAIIVASSGVFSTGVNIRNLHNIILASPTKSRIRNLQSIGRGLRLGDDKDQCTLFDIGDDLSWKSRQNHTLLHLAERITIYNEEGFEYRVITVPF
jgi:superfamily II DNA or RNA helicase